MTRDGIIGETNQRTALVGNCFVEVSLSGSYHAKGDLRFRDSHRPPLLPVEGRACPNDFLGQLASTLRLPDLPIATHCREVELGWINYKEWRAQVDATRGCSAPIHLRGASAILNRDGAVLLERAGTVLASCENRRESVCPACTAAGSDGRTLMGCVAPRGGGQQDEPALVHTRAEPETYFGAGCAQQMHEAMEALRHAESGRGISSRERTIREWAQPIRRWMEAGLVVTGGGCPAVAYDPGRRPLMGLWTPFPQERLAGTLMPEETIGRGAALRMWTINNAYATFEEDHTGTVEPGKLADLAVPSGDPLTVPDERFLDIKSFATNLDGRTLHEHAAV